LAELQGRGVQLKLVLLPDVLTEDLIRQVAEGDLEGTVADSNIALLNQRYYPHIRIAFPISEEQPLAWAVRKGEADLLTVMNDFMNEIRSNGILSRIRNMYYDDRNIMGKVDLKTFHKRLETRLPRYRPMIRAAAEKHGFDWRFITAMIYQESHFDPLARSYTGVRGLMQLTRETAVEMGIDDRLDPEQSIRAGVQYLAYLHELFEEIEDQTERLLFALTSYNVGYGHVRDAQRIARQKGHDPATWISLRQVLPLLSRPEYYRETRYGYARGEEPVRYVNNVLTYYDIMIGKTTSATRTQERSET
jgi:membrane-bound lytic murein transglycosylase F